MDGMHLLLLSSLYFLAAYLLYGKYLSRLFGVDDRRECPAHTSRDGIDYVPTPMPVLFGHHFASIAGAGPIVAPILAAKLGWLPAILWILIGCVFVGAMHDFAAMFLSVRHQGRSIAYVIERELGYAGRQLFLLFCYAALLLVVAVFARMVAASFIAEPAVATASILFILLAPLFGVALNRNILSLAEGTLIFVPLLFACVWLGTRFPLDAVRIFGSPEAALTFWIAGMLYYAFTASIIPVWLLLQPRDYLNSFLLYAMIILAMLGIIAARPAMNLPAVALAPADWTPGLFPLLFVTIACGACSGFHALVSSGTSAKQIDRECHIRPVAYGGMLVEGVLAVIAICSVISLSRSDLGSQLGNQAPQMLFASGIARLCESIGISFATAKTFFALALSAFIMTSLDTATRLARFIFQEMVLPQEQQAPAASPPRLPAWRQMAGNRWFACACVILPAALLAYGKSGLFLWPVFGASNQLLAALTLLTVTLYLYRRQQPFLFALLPFCFMYLISLWALAVLCHGHWNSNPLLAAVSIFLLLLALFLGALAARSAFSLKKRA